MRCYCCCYFPRLLLLLLPLLVPLLVLALLMVLVLLPLVQLPLPQPLPLLRRASVRGDPGAAERDRYYSSIVVYYHTVVV